MADEKLEIEIVLDDGSIQKGFLGARKEAKKTESSIKRAFTADLSKPFDRIRGSILNLRTALIGAVGVFAGGAFLRRVTRLASEQEDAVNALNNSLRTAGEFSQQASQDFQDFASSLQSVSIFGDEVILQQAALARNFTRSNAEAQKLTKAALDLASATGTSLDTAVQNLGVTLSGQAGTLARTLPAVREFTAEQLKSGAALDFVSSRFEGSALAATFTYSGALAQLNNTFGDFLERIGEFFTNSPVIINTFKALSSTIETLSSNIAGGGRNIDQFLKDLVIASAATANAIIDSFSVIAQLPAFFEFVFTQVRINVIKSLDGLVVATQGVLGPISGLLDRVFFEAGATEKSLAENVKTVEQLERRLLTLASRGNEISDGFRFASSSVDEFITKFQELSVTARPELGGGDDESGGGLIGEVDKQLSALREKVSELQTETRQTLQDTFFNADEAIADTPSIFEDLSDKSTEALKKLQEELNQTRNTAIRVSQQITQAVQNGIANSIANSVGAAVSALQSGEDAFAAFAQAGLATIGDLAVQLGQTLIAAGLGIESLKLLSGGAAIAAGVALVAVGTLIKGFAGGGQPNIGAGGSAVTPPLGDLTPGGISNDLNEPRQGVNITIEGNVFDSTETGIRIADILKDQGFSDAVIA